MHLTPKPGQGLRLAAPASLEWRPPGRRGPTDLCCLSAATDSLYLMPLPAVSSSKVSGRLPKDGTFERMGRLMG